MMPVTFLFSYNISTLIIKIRKIFYFLFSITFISFVFFQKLIPDAYSSELGKLIIHNTPKSIPIIEFYNLNGTKVQLSQWQGKYVILALWASWCTPCMQELIDLDDSIKDFTSNDIYIIPLSQDKEGIKAVNKTWEKLNIKDLIPYIDKTMNSGKNLLMRGLPTTLFINKNGHEIARLEGATNWKDQQLKKQITSLFKGL